ncbi:hypothetical protein C8R48DRAFT_706665 [Suillus tomentosus]|nr:hypothetical protein C8R48DRAFT_706665 [Suillus tomentosus]
MAVILLHIDCSIHLPSPLTHIYKFQCPLAHLAQAFLVSSHEGCVALPCVAVVFTFDGVC